MPERNRGQTGVTSYNRWVLLSLARFLLASVVTSAHLAGSIDAPVAGLVGTAMFEAVAGFLVISGYSIGVSYAARPQNFYLRRVERIYPVYLCALMVNVLAVGWPSVGVGLANLFFLNQLVTTTSFIGPAWSLALEVWLYALTPLIATASARMRWIAIALSLAAYLLFAGGKAVFGWPYFASIGYGGNLLLLGFFWLLGFMLATQPRQRLTLLSLTIALAMVQGLAFVVQAVSRFRHDDLALLPSDAVLFLWRGLVLVSVVATFLLIVTGRTGERRSTFANWLGDISYPLFLLNYPMFHIMRAWGVADAWSMIAVVLIASAALAYLVELPTKMIRRRDRPAAFAT